MRFTDWLTVYGDLSYRGDCLREDTEQINFFSWLSVHHKQLAALALHPKNESRRSWGQVNYDKKTGAINTGASDIVIPGAPSFVCEMKRKNHTKSSWQPGQIDYLKAASDAGCFVCVALGADEAKEAIGDYLELIATTTNRGNT
jgi:hypothetical protein